MVAIGSREPLGPIDICGEICEAVTFPTTFPTTTFPTTITPP